MSRDFLEIAKKVRDEIVQTVYFGSFIDILYPLVESDLKESGYVTDDTSFAEDLLCSADFGDAYNSSEQMSRRSTISRFRTGERAISRKIAVPFYREEAHENVRDYMEDRIVPYIVSGRSEFLISQLVMAIQADSTIDQEFKDKLLKIATIDTIAEFLAEVLIFTIKSTPFNIDKRIQKIGGAALTILIDEAVPEVVKRVLALQYLQYDDSPEVAEALKEGRFEDLLKMLVKERRMSGKEYYQWRNILKITGIAQDKLQQDIDDNGEYAVSSEFDIDWYMQFFNYAGSISDEEMQRWWAKLLAGEIGQPKRFSKSTLRVLHEMSNEDAKLFAVAARVAISARAESDYPPFVPDTDELGCYLIDGSRMILLIECGLIESPRTIQVNTGPRYLFENRNKRFVISVAKKDPSSPPVKLPVDVYFFTRAGKELLPLLPESDDDFLFLLASSLKRTHEDHYDIKVCSYDSVNKRLMSGKLKSITEDDDGTITYEYEIVKEEIEDDDLLTDFSFEKTMNKKGNQYWRYFHEQRFADIEDEDDSIEW